MVDMDLNRKEFAGEIGRVQKRVRPHRHGGVCSGQWRERNKAAQPCFPYSILAFANQPCQSPYPGILSFSPLSCLFFELSGFLPSVAALPNLRMDALTKRSSWPCNAGL